MYTEALDLYTNNPVHYASETANYVYTSSRMLHQVFFFCKQSDRHSYCRLVPCLTINRYLRAKLEVNCSSKVLSSLMH